MSSSASICARSSPKACCSSKTTTIWVHGPLSLVPCVMKAVTHLRAQGAVMTCSSASAVLLFADSDEVAWRSEMMSPGFGASLARIL